MSTEVTKGAQTALTIRDDQTTFTPEQEQALLHHAGVSRNAQPADVEVFFHQVKRTGLDPFAKQIYMIERQGKQTIQTGIDGFRLIARRSVDRTGETLGYEETLYADQNGNWHELLPKGAVPVAAKVVVLRNGQRFPGTAMYDEYVGLKRGGEVNSMWATKPGAMLAKCAEALALRKAFPQDLSGLYTADEMQQADNNTQPAQRPARVQQAAPSAPSPAPVGDNAPDQIDLRIEQIWDDPQQIMTYGKWLRNAHPSDSRIERLLARYNELTQQANDTAEPDVVDEAPLPEQTAAEQSEPLWKEPQNA